MRNLLRIFLRPMASWLYNHPRIGHYIHLLMGLFFIALIFWRKLIFIILDVVLYEDLTKIKAGRLIKEIQRNREIPADILTDPDVASIFFLLAGIFFLGRFIKAEIPLPLKEFRIRKSRVKPFGNLLKAFFFFGFLFWTQPLLTFLEIIFGDRGLEKKTSDLVKLLQQKNDFNFEIIEYSFREGKGGAIFAILLFGGFSLYFLYLFIKNFFDFRIYLAMNKEGLQVISRGFFHWDDITSITFETVVIDNPGGENSIKEYLIVTVRNDEDIRIQVNLLNYSEMQFLYYLRRFNRNNDIEVDL